MNDKRTKQTGGRATLLTPVDLSGSSRSIYQFRDPPRQKVRCSNKSEHTDFAARSTLGISLPQSFVVGKTGAYRSEKPSLS